MKHLWALSSTLVLSITIVVSSVAAGATTQRTSSASESRPVTVAALATVPAHGFYWQLTAAQDVVPGTVLLTRRGAHGGSRGTRSDDQFFEISRTGSNDVPEAALRAYQRAEIAMATANPDCNISWTLLAAIGRVESNHGRFGGSVLGADGISRPEIRGPRLDGAGPFAAIADSDDGQLDRDRLWDRAVGQMQFLPETWSSVARDGDGDGRMNPDDIDDSALGSAVYLCGAGGSLADSAGMARAAFRYNHSDYYVSLVLSFQAGYQTGVFALPSPPPPPAPTTTARTTAAKQRVTKPRSTKPRHPVVKTPTTKQSTPPRPSPTPAPAPKPAPKPSPKPTPSAPPSPSGPVLVQESGSWNACGLNFCLGGAPLDLGPLGIRNDRADADFDRDGAVESNGEEFAGLTGTHVSLLVERNLDGLVVYEIDGQGLRNADGSFARATAAASTVPLTEGP